MLPFQVGATDRSRRRDTPLTFSRRPAHVNRPSPDSLLSICALSLLLCVITAAPNVSGQSKGYKKKGRATAKASASPAEQSLTNIPLPIGHEAKGLVLPDFDGDGHLRGKFEAGTAHRIDQEHIGFQQLKITTYTPQSQPDLQIDMLTSVLDLKTKILSSQERTTIQRSDRSEEHTSELQSRGHLVC